MVALPPRSKRHHQARTQGRPRSGQPRKQRGFRVRALGCGNALIQLGNARIQRLEYGRKSLRGRRPAL